MTDFSQRLAQTLQSAIHKNPILPVKTEQGILVGSVLIVSNGHLKNLWQHNQLVYKEISLNKAAIKIANLLAKSAGTSVLSEKIYQLDQEYGRWYTESQLLRAQYQKSLNNQDHDRADMFWARYSESRDRMISAKNRAEALCTV